MSNNIMMTYNSVFLNSDAMFVEFNDVINSPFFSFLLSAQNNEELNNLIDASVIRGLSKEELFEWYKYRNDQNLFLSFVLRPELESNFKNDDEIKEWSDRYLYRLLDNHPDFVSEYTNLPFLNTMHNIVKTTLVSKFYIYTPVYSKTIESYINKEFNEKARYVYGKLTDVIKENNITNNSTFVFSELKKLQDLKDADVLNQSSVIVADRFGYNYELKEYIIDPYKVGDGCIFKLNFFNNI